MEFRLGRGEGVGIEDFSVFHTLSHRPCFLCVRLWYVRVIVFEARGVILN